MLSNSRSLFLLLACLALIALLLTGASAASSANTHGIPTKMSMTFTVDGASLTDNKGSWHSSSPDSSPDNPVVDSYDNDVDGDLAMPTCMDFCLNPLRFDAPIGVILPVRTTRAAPLPRPPDLV